MRTRTSVLALALLGAACSEPFGPESLVGVYEARDFAKVYVEFEGHSLEGLSATLHLGPDGQGMHRVLILRTDLETGEETPIAHEEPLRYTIEGMTVRTSIVNPCPGNCSSVVDPPDYRILPGGKALMELDRDEPMTYAWSTASYERALR